MFKRFVHYYKNHKLILFLDMTAAFLIAVTGIAYPIITRVMLNDWIPNNNLNLIIIGGASLVAIYLVRMGLRYFVQYYGHVMGVHMQGEMRTDLFNKLQTLPYSYFDNHETGVIMSTMTNDLFDISELSPSWSRKPLYRLIYCDRGYHLLNVYRLDLRFSAPRCDSNHLLINLGLPS